MANRGGKMVDSNRKEEKENSIQEKGHRSVMERGRRSKIYFPIDYDNIVIFQPETKDRDTKLLALADQEGVRVLRVHVLLRGFLSAGLDRRSHFSRSPFSTPQGSHFPLTPATTTTTLFVYIHA